MKKTTVIVLISLASLTTFFFIKMNLEKNKFTNEIDYVILDNNWKTSSKKISYDWKRGLYYAEITFDDEPSIVYNFEYLNKKIISFAFDSNNNEITNKKLSHILE